VAPGTVKSRMHRALQRLQTLLNAEYPELQEHIE
jgi:DNA-directed RNA polymerase specialized sigma24 family protein